MRVRRGFALSDASDPRDAPMATLKKGGGKTRVCYFYDSDVRTAAARFQLLSRDFFRARARAICLMIKCVRRSLHRLATTIMARATR